MKIKAASIAKAIVALTATTLSLCARAASFEVVSADEVARYPGAIGGDEIRKIENDDGTIDFIHIFTNTSATVNFTIPGVNAIRSGSGRILVVGGGAGGSGDCGGGGGAGGLIYKEGLTLASGTVSVGAGGPQSASGATGNNGMNTVLTLGSTAYTALGGGTGGRWSAYAGTDGGSGGGSTSGDTARNTPGQALQPTSASGGFGNPGGRGGPNDMGGGGGGAGSAGADATSIVAGDGGAGLEFDISGEMSFYAAGGGGGATHGRTLGKGGSGIGGDGLNNKGTTPAGAGKPGTGSGGGGGGGGGGGTSIGGAGGSGIVIVRYAVERPIIEIAENVKNKVYSIVDTELPTYLKITKKVKADILVVGGGGAGANPGGANPLQGGAGGGGAGGMIEIKGVYLEPGGYDIEVGKGGISPDTQGPGGNGYSSLITRAGAVIYEAFGGGGGGFRSDGNDGGSGGGGSRTGNGGNATQPTLTYGGYGNSGGKGSNYQAGAGGGGAGGNGGDTVDTNVGGNGGLGKVSSITGSDVYYAAGGGGGTSAGNNSATGGSGIGGDGGYSEKGATAGKRNTGSGGGGGRLNERGGNGGSGIVIIRIIEVLPDKPNSAYNIDYDGETHVLYKGGENVVITKDGDEVSEIAVRDAGTYNYVVSLNGASQWSDLTDDVSVNVTVTVNAPQITVESLTIEPWQIGQRPNEPIVVTSPFQVSRNDYTVKYSPKGMGTWSETAPSVAGEWDVTIEFKESQNFTVSGTIPKETVTLWGWSDSEKYLDSLGYHSVITITEPNSVSSSYLAVRVRISDDSPKGFKYRFANNDGSDIRFLDSNGNLIAHEIEEWNTGGESVVRLKVPGYFDGTSLTMCWGELAGKTPPQADGNLEWNANDNTQASSVRYALSETRVMPGAYFKNRWIVEPSISKTFWNIGETPAEVIQGEAAYGAAYYTFTSAAEKIVNRVPDSVGEYVFCGSADRLDPVEGGAFGYEPLTSTKADVLILDVSPDSGLGGTSDNATLAGRVLLANDWGDGEGAIVGQDYSSIDPTASSYWVHNEVLETSSQFPYLKTSKESELRARDSQTELCGSKLIWHLDNVRIGNWYPKDGTMDSGRNYLPWSGKAHPNGVQSESSHLVIRNIKDAAIYSPCYTNGIGTIYFDAVNAATPTVQVPAESYKLVLEYCTEVHNPLSSTAIPSDENIKLQEDTRFERLEDEDGNPVLDEDGNEIYNEIPGVTNRYYYAESQWKRATMSVLKRDGTETFSEPFETDELTLDVANGGTTKNFYRVYAKFNYTGPVRFRIRRFTKSDYMIDDAAFILVDNVVVSYPSMRMDLESHGKFDGTKTGKRTLGFEGAFETPFPALNGDIVARAKPRYTVSGADPNADTSKFVISSKIFYRWRYLDQKTDEWRSIPLNHRDGFKAVEPFKLPKDLIGDVEYYYVSLLNAPYYDYVDYSGSDLKLGGYYTENTSVVTNRLDSPKILESGGTDWFIRLRDGVSDYETVNLVVAERIDEDRKDTVYKTNSIPMELIGEGVWRGLYKTTDANPNGIEYRFEFLNRQTPGATDPAASTNYWTVAKSYEKLWISDVLTETQEPVYSSIPSNGETGYLLFQVDENTKAITVVRADYQDFNGWSDANNSDGAEVFLGNSTDNNGKTGVSPKSVATLMSTAGWTNMPNTDKLWTEGFDTTTTLTKEDYVEFVSARTPNGWTAKKGMFVYSNYKTGGITVEVEGGSAIDRAFQMRGNGNGSLEFVDKDNSPRGLETINFSARLAQAIDFNDIAYYDAGSKMSMTNYTIIAGGAFDAKQNTAFRGNATLSLFAYYRRRVGAYELRVEQVGANKSGDTVSPAPRGQRLSLYRWNYDGNGRLVVTPLGSRDNTAFNKNDWPKPNGVSGFQPIYLSVSNTVDGVCISAGFKSDNNVGVGRAWTMTDVNAKNYNNIVYYDTSAERLTAGTYGLQAANSEGHFARPMYLPKPVSLMGKLYQDLSKTPNKINWYTHTVINFLGTAELCYDDIVAEEWSLPPVRMIEDSNIQGLKAGIPKQTVNVYTAPRGSTDWDLLTSKEITSFGSSGKKSVDTIKVYTTSDCSVKIESGGDDFDIRTDLVIDDLKLTQFRGGDWDDAADSVPGWEPDVYYNGYTNFIFTSAWIRDSAIMLSARRTGPDMPSSIRSPLYDGNVAYGRGIGLGMFSFTYKNAHKNVKLQLQIATNNVSEASMSGIDDNDGMWETYKTFDFSKMSAEDLRGNTLSCYLGLRGVKGIMRLRMDPSVVESSKGLMNAADFPEIYITDVYTRDEPLLDHRAWWGWNLRTLGDAEDSEKRMYLYDKSRGIQSGMSLALNNSISDDVKKMNEEEYKQYQPFVQTPTFSTNIVGEVSFKARKYDADNPQHAQITLYGSATGAVESDWEPLEVFTVSNSTYTSYSFKTQPNTAYSAFRLGVAGVDGVVPSTMPNKKPTDNYRPVRVLIEEVLVSEAIRARFEFRNAGAFRTKLDTTGCVPNVPSAAEQPLAGESWGVQCEVFPSQLADEIDLSRKPVVKFHWFEGEHPWGYNHWRTNAGARVAYLAPATNTNNIYRSSYMLAQEAVVPPSLKSSATIQYELEVIYYTKGSSTPQTNFLSEAKAWQTPSWYRGVDKNAGKSAFSAYTIIDSVAPGWAWINEVNIFSDEGPNFTNLDSDYQFVEIAVPAEANIQNWSVRMVEMLDDETIVTNTIATFGYNNLEPTKPNLLNMASNMVYRVIGNPESARSGRLKRSDGTLDGVWTMENGGFAMNKSGAIWYTFPIGVQLIRASGIVEHEISLVGLNPYEPGDLLYEENNPAKTAEQLNRLMKGSRFVYIGDDNYGGDTTLSVMTSRGETKDNWLNNVRSTPGRVNAGQYIDPDHPTPNGSSILVYANLNTDFGHIFQTIGNGVQTNGNAVLIIPKGSEKGTNITYTVDQWYDFAGVTTNGVSAPWTESGLRTFTATVGVGASNNVTVVASAKLSDKLVNDYGLGPDNGYRDAIIDWLEKRVNARGEPWAHPDSTDISLAEYQSLSGNFVTNLTLTQMYWLDMDPTVSNLVLRGGMSSPPNPVARTAGIEGADYIENAPNFKMGVKLYITNATEDVDSPYYNRKAWAPYVLRGRAKGETSLNYASSPVSWSNVTFKVTGYLNNGLNQIGNKNNWIPQRWFVFQSDSFDENFEARIEIRNPFGKNTPGYSNGWYDWHLSHPEDGVFFSWSLDTRLRQFPVEPLREENYYDYQ